MSVEIERATLPCDVCGAGVAELRRGRCWGCYTRWSDSRPVGKGASCSVCQERRRDQLKLVELHERSLPLCHSCAARAMRLAPMPTSIERIRRELRRERRALDRRGGTRTDHRIFPRERRVGDRREDRAAERRARKDVTDPHAVAPDFDDLIIEIQEADLELIEHTSVREPPPSPVDPLAVTPTAARSRG